MQRQLPGDPSVQTNNISQTENPVILEGSPLHSIEVTHKSITKPQEPKQPQINNHIHDNDNASRASTTAAAVVNFGVKESPTRRHENTKRDKCSNNKNNASSSSPPDSTSSSRATNDSTESSRDIYIEYTIQGGRSWLLEHGGGGDDAPPQEDDYDDVETTTSDDGGGGDSSRNLNQGVSNSSDDAFQPSTNNTVLIDHLLSLADESDPQNNEHSFHHHHHHHRKRRRGEQQQRDPLPETPQSPTAPKRTIPYTKVKLDAAMLSRRWNANATANASMMMAMMKDRKSQENQECNDDGTTTTEPEGLTDTTVTLSTIAPSQASRIVLLKPNPSSTSIQKKDDKTNRTNNSGCLELLCWDPYCLQSGDCCCHKKSKTVSSSPDVAKSQPQNPSDEMNETNPPHATSTGSGDMEEECNDNNVDDDDGLAAECRALAEAERNLGRELSGIQIVETTVQPPVTQSPRWSRLNKINNNPTQKDGHDPNTVLSNQQQRQRLVTPAGTQSQQSSPVDNPQKQRSSHQPAASPSPRGRSKSPRRQAKQFRKQRKANDTEQGGGGVGEHNSLQQTERHLSPSSDPANQRQRRRRRQLRRHLSPPNSTRHILQRLSWARKNHRTLLDENWFYGPQSNNNNNNNNNRPTPGRMATAPPPPTPPPPLRTITVIEWHQPEDGTVIFHVDEENSNDPEATVSTTKKVDADGSMTTHDQRQPANTVAAGGQEDSDHSEYHRGKFLSQRGMPVFDKSSSSKSGTAGDLDTTSDISLFIAKQQEKKNKAKQPQPSTGENKGEEKPTTSQGQLDPHLGGEVLSKRPERSTEDGDITGNVENASEDLQERTQVKEKKDNETVSQPLKEEEGEIEIVFVEDDKFQSPTNFTYGEPRGIVFDWLPQAPKRKRYVHEKNMVLSPTTNDRKYIQSPVISLVSPRFDEENNNKKHFAPGEIESQVISLVSPRGDDYQKRNNDGEIESHVISLVSPRDEDDQEHRHWYHAPDNYRGRSTAIATQTDQEIQTDLWNPNHQGPPVHLYEQPKNCSERKPAMISYSSSAPVAVGLVPPPQNITLDAPKVFARPTNQLDLPDLSFQQRYGVDRSQQRRGKDSFQGTCATLPPSSHRQATSAHQQGRLSDVNRTALQPPRPETMNNNKSIKRSPWKSRATQHTIHEEHNKQSPLAPLPKEAKPPLAPLRHHQSNDDADWFETAHRKSQGDRQTRPRGPRETRPTTIAGKLSISPQQNYTDPRKTERKPSSRHDEVPGLFRTPSDGMEITICHKRGEKDSEDVEIVSVLSMEDCTSRFRRPIHTSSKMNDVVVVIEQKPAEQNAGNKSRVMVPHLPQNIEKKQRDGLQDDVLVVDAEEEAFNMMQRKKIERWMEQPPAASNISSKHYTARMLPSDRRNEHDQRCRPDPSNPCLISHVRSLRSKGKDPEPDTDFQAKVVGPDPSDDDTSLSPDRGPDPPGSILEESRSFGNQQQSPNQRSPQALSQGRGVFTFDNERGQHDSMNEDHSPMHVLEIMAQRWKGRGARIPLFSSAVWNSEYIASSYTSPPASSQNIDPHVSQETVGDIRILHQQHRKIDPPLPNPRKHSADNPGRTSASVLSPSSSRESDKENPKSSSRPRTGSSRLDSVTSEDAVVDARSDETFVHWSGMTEDEGSPFQPSIGLKSQNKQLRKQILDKEAPESELATSRVECETSFAQDGQTSGQQPDNVEEGPGIDSGYGNGVQPAGAERFEAQDERESESGKLKQTTSLSSGDDDESSCQRNWIGTEKSNELKLHDAETNQSDHSLASNDGFGGDTKGCSSDRPKSFLDLDVPVSSGWNVHDSAGTDLVGASSKPAHIDDCSFVSLVDYENMFSCQVESISENYCGIQEQEIKSRGSHTSSLVQTVPFEPQKAASQHALASSDGFKIDTSCISGPPAERAPNMGVWLSQGLHQQRSEGDQKNPTRSKDLSCGFLVHDENKMSLKVDDISEINSELEKKEPESPGSKASTDQAPRAAGSRPELSLEERSSLDESAGLASWPESPSALTKEGCDKEASLLALESDFETCNKLDVSNRREKTHGALKKSIRLDSQSQEKRLFAAAAEGRNSQKDSCGTISRKNMNLKDPEGIVSTQLGTYLDKLLGKRSIRLADNKDRNFSSRRFEGLLGYPEDESISVNQLGNRSSHIGFPATAFSEESGLIFVTKAMQERIARSKEPATSSWAGDVDNLSLASTADDSSLPLALRLFRSQLFRSLLVDSAESRDSATDFSLETSSKSYVPVLFEPNTKSFQSSMVERQIPVVGVFVSDDLDLNPGAPASAISSGTVDTDNSLLDDTSQETSPKPTDEKDLVTDDKSATKQSKSAETQTPCHVDSRCVALKSSENQCSQALDEERNESLEHDSLSSSSVSAILAPATRAIAANVSKSNLTSSSVDSNADDTHVHPGIRSMMSSCSSSCESFSTNVKNAIVRAKLVASDNDSRSTLTFNISDVYGDDADDIMLPATDNDERGSHKKKVVTFSLDESRTPEQTHGLFSFHSSPAIEGILRSAQEALGVGLGAGQATTTNDEVDAEGKQPFHPLLSAVDNCASKDDCRFKQIGKDEKMLLPAIKNMKSLAEGRIQLVRSDTADSLQDPLILLAEIPVRSNSDSVSSAADEDIRATENAASTLLKTTGKESESKEKSMIIGEKGAKIAADTPAPGQMDRIFRTNVATSSRTVVLVKAKKALERRDDSANNDTLGHQSQSKELNVDKQAPDHEDDESDDETFDTNLPADSSLDSRSHIALLDRRIRRIMNRARKAVRRGSGSTLSVRVSTGNASSNNSQNAQKGCQPNSMQETPQSPIMKANSSSSTTPVNMTITFEVDDSDIINSYSQISGTKESQGDDDRLTVRKRQVLEGNKPSSRVERTPPRSNPFQSLQTATGSVGDKQTSPSQLYFYTAGDHKKAIDGIALLDSSSSTSGTVTSFRIALLKSSLSTSSHSNSFPDKLPQLTEISGTTGSQGDDEKPSVQTSLALKDVRNAVEGSSLLESSSSISGSVSFPEKLPQLRFKPSKIPLLPKGYSGMVPDKFPQYLRFRPTKIPPLPKRQNTSHRTSQRKRITRSKKNRKGQLGTAGSQPLDPKDLALKEHFDRGVSDSSSEPHGLKPGETPGISSSAGPSSNS
ncbi:hypothetical protein ACA910_013204 [Epithemia clementina (nom. ined.)]